MTVQATTRPAGAASATRRISGEKVALWGVTLIVFTAQLVFAMVMNDRRFLWGDAVSRASSALIALHSSDPHLAATGFVWLPLPTLFELAPAALYPRWPEIVSSGFASSIVTVLAGTLSSGIVFGTARRLGLSVALTSIYTLLVAFSPMLFLFSTNGMSEGVAAPALIGSVCCLVLFWNDGQRRYVAASGFLLAIGFACLYQAVHFGAVMAGALALGLFSRENEPSYPQGRLRAIEGLSILFLVPSIYVGIIWIVSNYAIMGDPFYFAHSIYSNESIISSSGAGRIAGAVKGDLSGSIEFAFVRTLPFLIPMAACLAVRAIEGRLMQLNTLSLAGLSLVVPFGLIVPQLYDGTSFGWLRYFMYPLFVAAGWGLYEISKSRHRAVAVSLILGAWAFVIPASLVAMNDPKLGQNEYQIVRSIWTGDRAAGVGYPLYFDDVEPVAAVIDALDEDEQVLADASNAWTVAATVSPASLKHKLILTADDRFHGILEDPAETDITYFLVPNPEVAPQDLLNMEYPNLWAGSEPGFTLVRDFDETGVGWRLYRVDR